MLKVNQTTKRWSLRKGIHRFVFLSRSRKGQTERNGQGRSLFNETKKDDRFLHLIGSGHLSSSGETMRTHQPDCLIFS